MISHSHAHDIITHTHTHSRLRVSLLVASNYLSRIPWRIVVPLHAASTTLSSSRKSKIVVLPLFSSSYSFSVSFSFYRLLPLSISFSLIHHTLDFLINLCILEIALARFPKHESLNALSPSNLLESKKRTVQPPR